MNYNWDWGILFREPYLNWLLDGLGWTVSLSLMAWIIAFSLGSILGIMRTSISPTLRFIGTVYVEIFRNVPLLVQLFCGFLCFQNYCQMMLVDG
jgi:glutamate/aspartate transport system permease protein